MLHASAQRSLAPRRIKGENGDGHRILEVRAPPCLVSPCFAAGQMSSSCWRHSVVLGPLIRWRPLLVPCWPQPAHRPPLPTTPYHTRYTHKPGLPLTALVPRPACTERTLCTGEHDTDTPMNECYSNFPVLLLLYKYTSLIRVEWRN